MTKTECGQVKFGATLIDYRIVRSKRRRKTVEITLDPYEGVLVSAPVDTDAVELEGIVRKRAPWIARKTSEGALQSRRKNFVSGESLPYLGRQVRLFVELADVRRVKIDFEHWNFNVTAPFQMEGLERRDAIEAAFRRWYRQRAEGLLPSRVERWSSRLGVTASNVLARDQRQRWASCSADGTLRFNWRTVMVAPTLIDYVIVHELVHLTARNHSPDFWQQVAAILPDFKIRRVRLKEAGWELTL